MEATPPQEPRKKETPPSPPPETVVRTSKRAPRPKPVAVAAVEEEIAPPEIDDIDPEQEATRIFGALALGVMAVLLVCIIAFLIAYRHAPEGL